MTTEKVTDSMIYLNSEKDLGKVRDLDLDSKTAIMTVIRLPMVINSLKETATNLETKTD